ncbi:Membrane-fusion protein [Pedobacter sp. BAL39]|nr:Membrane-fusion protein [Pedobacter sp. BAL39]
MATVGCHQPEPVKKTDTTIPVKLISADELQETEAIQSSGLLSSEQQSNLSFKTGGIINAIKVKEGDHVRRGQVLALLNMTEVNANLGQAEAQYQKARRDAQRIANLYRDSVSTREQLENSQTALDIAKKQYDIARFNTTQSSIIANTDGVVLKKLANEGEQVTGGTPVLYISSIASKDWVIKCGITDKERSRIHGNENAELHFDVLPQTVRGKVKSIAQGSDAGSGLYQVEIRLEPEGVKLVSGLFAKVKIFPSGKTELLSVPMDAIVEGNNDSAFVFTAVNQKAAKKTVRVAYMKDGKAFISSGISSQDRVIREGSAYLSEGSSLRIVK